MRESERTFLRKAIADIERLRLASIEGGFATLAYLLAIAKAEATDDLGEAPAAAPPPAILSVVRNDRP